MKKIGFFRVTVLLVLVTLLLAGRTFEVSEFFVKSGQIIQIEKDPPLYALRQGNETQALFTTAKGPGYISIGPTPWEGKEMHLVRLALRWRKDYAPFVQLDLHW